MNHRLQTILPVIASIAVGVVPVYILIAFFDVPRKTIVGWGVLSYVIGVTAVKMPLYHLVLVKYLHEKLSHRWLSVTQGMVSAFSELGIAFAFFVLVVPDLSLAQLIGFGAAAGSVEAIVLPFVRNPFKGTPLEKQANAVNERTSESLLIEWMAVLERVLCMFPHIASRGMVYISFLTSNIIPALVSVVMFAAIDGRAYFAHLEHWRFEDVHVLWRFYRYLALIALLQTVCFAAFYGLLV